MPRCDTKVFCQRFIHFETAILGQPFPLLLLTGFQFAQLDLLVVCIWGLVNRPLSLFFCWILSWELTLEVTFCLRNCKSHIWLCNNEKRCFSLFRQPFLHRQIVNEWMGTLFLFFRISCIAHVFVISLRKITKITKFSLVQVKVKSYPFLINI
jgi:hypothetical protein